ncbi:hypothetical protein EDB89DRAFT_2013655 [Lactarius sanguifluus]|nr:hypothetical protein EDB89DRAFT_2013655 [Lactarius sanguifluus]
MDFLCATRLVVQRKSGFFKNSLEVWRKVTVRQIACDMVWSLEFSPFPQLTVIFEVSPQALLKQLLPNMQTLCLRATLATEAAKAEEGLSRLALWSMDTTSPGMFFFLRIYLGSYVFIPHHTHCDLTFFFEEKGVGILVPLPSRQPQSSPSSSLPTEASKVEGPRRVSRCGLDLRWDRHCAASCFPQALSGMRRGWVRVN